MIYIDEQNKVQCTENCMSCEKDNKKCEARKERGRYWNRIKYKAKKEYKRKKVKK